ncbi:MULTISPECIES: TetR/AcrR family transcriptional regulator [Thermomonosporaceae]|uniref:TetR/AcrR family transcriptional regulator n=1 Tax=Thermomonosporaceae TaxID=2012 RepID=UPI00255B3AF3|nr:MULTISPECIES: TetR/AcrR family transcriptional regulator [Thermomonosporaceae]MDL4774631.1 TetR/AcrR family transcriptional regulator [Actinomadura xylanilytica]
MPTERTSTTGRPPRISREEIVEAAHRVVDAEGAGKLTMRRLARELGCTPMALYHHVRDKDELLLLLLDDYAARLPRPEPPAEPRERIVAVATALRDGLAGLPWIAEVLTADDLLSVSALWYSEHIVDAAVQAGLTLDRAVHAYRAIWYYTAGEIIIRASAARRRADAGKPTYRERVFAEIDPEPFPRLASVAGRWAPLTAEDTYGDGLRALVDGLLAAR